MLQRIGFVKQSGQKYKHKYPAETDLKSTWPGNGLIINALRRNFLSRLCTTDFQVRRITTGVVSKGRLWFFTYPPPTPGQTHLNFEAKWGTAKFYWLTKSDYMIVDFWCSPLDIKIPTWSIHINNLKSCNLISSINKIWHFPVLLQNLDAFALGFRGQDTNWNYTHHRVAILPLANTGLEKLVSLIQASAHSSQFFL